MRIIIADDHCIFREGLKTFIQREPDWSVVGEAENGLELLQMLKSLTCDLIIMDITMPEMDGLTALKEVKRMYPEIKVLMLSLMKDYEHFEQAKIFGASGYLAKDDAGEDLIPAIKKIMRGKLHISSSVTNLLAERQLRSMDDGESPSLEILTKRERQVLQLIAKGMTNKEVGCELKISVHTVENHRAHLLEKLGLKNAVSLVKFAISKGLA